MNKKYYGYINTYQKDHYDRIILLAPKGLKDRLKEEAKAAGETLSSFIIKKLI